MTSSIQDAVRIDPFTSCTLDHSLKNSRNQFNLAWKLALVVKEQASPALLNSYEEERLPAIADMLLESAKLHRIAYGEKSGDTAKDSGIQKTVEALGNAAAPLTAASTTAGRDGKSEVEKNPALDDRFPRDRKLFQLDLNYRWSSIVLDERYTGSDSKKDAYGHAGHDLRAGDRAPDAPCLVILHSNAERVGKVSSKEGADIRLFDIFDVTVHTVLIFSSTANITFIKEIQITLQKLQTGLVHSILVVSDSTAAHDFFAQSADLVLSDKVGHAYRGYGINEGENAVVIVRPDAMVGAFARSAAGVERYFMKLFN